eukprot:746827-Hanusia_phi.AAC.3
MKTGQDRTGEEAKAGQAGARLRRGEKVGEVASDTQISATQRRTRGEEDCMAVQCTQEEGEEEALRAKLPSGSREDVKRVGNPSSCSEGGGILLLQGLSYPLTPTSYSCCY